ncbi:hypothetical protein [Scytonema sp. NUACC26]|uniref:hypothetical protein n=1 Tax=Scytonema sp. NUACC26 TaxID=3140176 RepID=UPI0034DC8E9A
MTQFSEFNPSDNNQIGNDNYDFNCSSCEREPNNSFATRQFLEFGSTAVYGELNKEGDVDFFNFSGVDKGSLFTVEITSQKVDSLLGWLDDSGNILAINDDQADNSVLSVLTGIVPESGNLNLAVTGLRDTNLVGNHFESGSYTLSLKTFTLPETSPNATVINGSFETGDFTGWTTLGETSIETAAFGSSPTDKTYQALLSTAGVTFADSIIEDFLGLEAGSLDNLGNGNAITGSAIRQTFTAQAGDILTFNWNYLTNEVVPPAFNDFSFVSINGLSELADRFFPSFVTSVTPFVEETGFQTFSFTVPISGTYSLGIGVMDTGDNMFNSGLLVDNFTLI